MTRHRWTRREVLRTGTAALAAPYLVPSHVLGAAGRPGANEKVNVAIIGLGGRARAVAGTALQVPEMQIVAVCDCFAPLCDAFASSVGKDRSWATYTDFRRMYDQEKLDGVMIETTTHARAWVAIQAMQAGMDVYIEKPMALTIAEGRTMVQAARKYNRVTQVGTQQRSMPINNWASDLVKNGALGKVHTVLAPNFVGPDKWTDQPAQPLPAGGSDTWWDIWTNQAEFRPYHSQLHRGWARWWAYDGGGLCFGVTGWGTHSYDQIQRALGTDETGPVEVTLEEPVQVMNTGKFEQGPQGNDDTGAEYHHMARPVIGPRAKVRMKFANGTELRLHLDGDWGPGLGAVFVGEKGKLEINRNKLAGNPKELIDSPDNPGPNRKPETQYHIEDWIRCIKTRERCTADIEYGQRSTTLCYLVNIVRDVGRVGEKLEWDPDAECFTNCDEGNRLLSRPRRKAYELPELT
ncbi:MAG TPA: Gfo/Idh/MocA family oxidoreductase [Thermoguttaceae bacterium]|nr:Gfo/Idh/MocA family oxidoreductase [Thermoguttaceae bacterium]